MTGRRRLLAAVLILGLVGSACQYTGDGAVQVALLGDSVADDATDEVAAAMHERYGFVGFTVRSGAIQDQLLRLAALLAEEPPDVLVLELGVGDAQLFNGDERMRADITTLLEAARGVECVRWPNLKVGGVNPFYQGVVARSDDFNRILGQTVSGYPNAEMVDYDLWAQARPGYYLADGLHLSDIGRDAYGRWLALRVAGDCRRR